MVPNIYMYTNNNYSESVNPTVKLTKTLSQKFKYDPNHIHTHFSIPKKCAYLVILCVIMRETHYRFRSDRISSPRSTFQADPVTTERRKQIFVKALQHYVARKLSLAKVVTAVVTEGPAN